VRLREQIEREEDARLSPWAQRASDSGGRLHAEDEAPYRTAFQRDRDRVLHSTGFRRLQYKTQVFVYHEGDHFRNRLTHTLEGSQIARTAARALGCNEDLTEAIVLAHDLGHTPFGHSGERALHRLLDAHGGFEHNRQSLRMVDWIERRYGAYPGLNLTAKTRAGILKHGAEYPLYSHPVALPDLGKQPSVEAQIANLSDDIAYHNHDIDDGLRSGLLTESDLLDVELWRRARERVGRDAPHARVIVALIDVLASDLIATSDERLRASGVASPGEVASLAEPLVGFSAEAAAAKAEVAGFLSERLYRHSQVARMGAKAERILRDLWTAYTQDDRLVPPEVLAPAPEEPRERALADYLAGMTDRFAMDEHKRLFDPHAHV
jgi:dGTPase